MHLYTYPMIYTYYPSNHHILSHCQSPCSIHRLRLWISTKQASNFHPVIPTNSNPCLLTNHRHTIRVLASDRKPYGCVFWKAKTFMRQVTLHIVTLLFMNLHTSYFTHFILTFLWTNEKPLEGWHSSPTHSLYQMIFNETPIVLFWTD